MITNDQRRTAKNLLATKLLELYSGDDQTQLNKRVIDTYNITADQKYIELLGDTILGFYKTTDLPRLFQQQLGMSADESQRLLSELIEFLTPVIEREQAESNIKKEDIAKLAETVEATHKDRPKELQPTGAPEAVPPLRTMQGDMNRIHGYGAARAKAEAESDEQVVQSAPQADLVGNTQTATPAPATPPAAAPTPTAPTSPLPQAPTSAPPRPAPTMPPADQTAQPTSPPPPTPPTNPSADSHTDGIPVKKVL